MVALWRIAADTKDYAVALSASETIRVDPMETAAFRRGS